MAQRLTPDQERFYYELRTTTKKQGTQMLVNISGGEIRYCCLGIWAEMCGKKPNEIRGHLDLRRLIEVRNKLGLRDGRGTTGLARIGNYYGPLLSLAHMNDYQPLMGELPFTFRRIAHWFALFPGFFFVRDTTANNS